MHITYKIKIVVLRTFNNNIKTNRGLSLSILNQLYHNFAKEEVLMLKQLSFHTPKVALFDLISGTFGLNKWHF